MAEREAEGSNPGRAGSLGISLANAGISVIGVGLDRRIEWTVNGCKLLGAALKPGASIDEVMPKDLLALAEGHILRHEAQTAGAAGPTAWPRGLSIETAAGTRWLDVWIDTAFETAGTPSFLITLVDTTDRQHREQTLRTLLREVAHRSKNMLAIVQAIATQTGRYASSTEQFLTRFRGRILSLASTQDIVTSSNWRGADLIGLIDSQVGRYVDDPRTSVHISGVSPYLDPNAALHIGLALHELAVNSLTYGALSHPGGSIGIEAKNDAAGRNLVLTWTEPLEPKDRSAVDRKFGSVTLERVVPAALGGSATLSVGSERLIYRLSIPSGSLGAG